MSIGFIKLHRKIIDWEWYSDINTTRLFFHLLITANFEDKKWRGIDIKRGQQISSYDNLAKATNLSKQQLRTALTKLKSTHELTITSTNHYTIFTLTNYTVYQDRKNDSNTPLTHQATNEQQTSNKQATLTKEIKEIKEIKEDNKYYPLAEGLVFVLESKLNKSFAKSTTKSWSEEIRKLIEIDLKNRDNAFGDVKNSIQVIGDNYGVDYFPVIQSGKSLRDKFDKIENFVARNKPNRSGMQEAVDKLKNEGWFDDEVTNVE